MKPFLTTEKSEAFLDSSCSLYEVFFTRYSIYRTKYECEEMVGLIWKWCDRNYSAVLLETPGEPQNWLHSQISGGLQCSCYPAHSLILQSLQCSCYPAHSLVLQSLQCSSSPAHSLVQQSMQSSYGTPAHSLVLLSLQCSCSPANYLVLQVQPL